MSTRVALVTGANKGLGREVARQLAARGIAVLVGSRDPDRGRTTANELVAEGLDVAPIAIDVVNEASVTEAAAEILASRGRLDVLVNNAGTITDVAATEMTAELLRPMFETNVFGVVTTTNAMVALLAAATSPRIVNMSSTTASLTLTSTGTRIPGDATRRLGYAASKAALNMLTVQYAAAFAREPELAHIKVNSACPGFTATDMNGYRGTRRVEDGAAIAVELALLPDDGPTAGFHADDGPVPW